MNKHKFKQIKNEIKNVVEKDSIIYKINMIIIDINKKINIL